MERREYLKILGVLGISGLAGCTDDYSGGEGPYSSGPDEDEVMAVENSFEVIPSDEAPDEPTITSRDGDTFVISGTIRVSNGCKSARLAHEPEITGQEPVSVLATIESYDETDGKGVCTMAIKEVGYELQLTSSESVDEFQIRHEGVSGETFILNVQQASQE